MPLLNEADAIYLGATAVDKVYFGTNEVWPAADYAAEVLADSPVGYWRLEETSGSTVADEIGTNDGTVYGANLNVDGQVGSAASFDGIDDYISIPYDAALNTATFTGEAIIRADAFSSTLTRVLSFRKNAHNGWEMLVTDIGRLRLEWGDGSATRNAESPTNTILTETTYHVAVTHDGTTGRAYVNGTEVAFFDASLSVNDTANMAIGNILWTVAGQRGHTGMIDEVAVYDTALSAARILAHAQAAGLA